MTQRASTIVEARALDSWSAWDQNDHMIYTYTRLAVTKTLKGAPGQYVVVRQMGGSADGYTQRVSGVRQFLPGDETVLFLRPSVAGNGLQAIVGLMQGNFRVVRSAGEVTVSNGVPDVSQYQGAGHATGIYTGTRMTLRELENRVSKAARQ
jgi:hypothetical protein